MSLGCEEDEEEEELFARFRDPIRSFSHATFTSSIFYYTWLQIYCNILTFSTKWAQLGEELQIEHQSRPEFGFSTQSFVLNFHRRISDPKKRKTERRTISSGVCVKIQIESFYRSFYLPLPLRVWDWRLILHNKPQN